MTEHINWGIIGCGNVSEVKSGPAFNKVDNSSLIAVMRRDGKKAMDYAQRHGVPKSYDDAQKLIDDPQINAIYIATPPVYHEHYCVAALKAGKYVYVEKPVTVSVESCKRMMDAEQQYGGKVCVAHYRRGLPLFLEIKRLVTEKKIGKIKMIRLSMFKPDGSAMIAKTETNWRTTPELSGGGLFFDLAPHQLDILQFIFGEPLSYSGIAANQSKLYNAEDAVSGLIRYKDDILFTGNWCFTMPVTIEEDACEIIGEHGKIKFAVFGHQYALHRGKQNQVIAFHPLEHIQQPMIKQVVNYFLDKQENPCSLTEALKTLEIMEAFIN
jgi:predicted dehydrogenase